MNWSVLKTEEEYNEAMERMMEIFHAEPNSPEDRELELLILLIKDYDDRNYSLPKADVLEVIKLKMDEQGLKNKDLEPLIGSKGHVSSVLSGKREITLKMAKKLKDYFNLPAELFLQ